MISMLRTADAAGLGDGDGCAAAVVHVRNHSGVQIEQMTQDAISSESMQWIECA